MVAAKSGGNPAPNFRPDPWSLIQDGFDTATLTVTETLTAQANGYLGTRGTYEEPVADDIQSTEGTYLNGIYLREEIHYDESAYGFASHNNKMIMVPDTKAMRIRANGELLQQGSGQITHQCRSLDMKTGLLERTSTWQTKTGSIIEVEARRMVAISDANSMMIEYKVTSKGFSGLITLETGIDAAYGSHKDSGDPRAGALSVIDCLSDPKVDRTSDVTAVTHAVTGGDQAIITAYSLEIESSQSHSVSDIEQRNFWGQRLEVTLGAEDHLLIRKHIYYGDAPAAKRSVLTTTAVTKLADAKADDFDDFLKEQTKSFSHLWASSDIEISGPAEVQQGMRFNLFQLFQSAGRDGRRALGAKGLSGAGYDGHYFWDTEIYAVPFFVFNHPEIARSLISYRINTLDAARTRARQMGHQSGALYPWRTIGGEECSSFFPAGSAQYHINAAVAYALMQYVDATGDSSLLNEGGAEMLFETARIWIQLGHFNNAHTGQFSIHEVTGPDEYSAMVDNNLYTNAMAQYHLARAAEVAASLQNNDPEFFQKLASKIALDATEPLLWQRASDAMYLPYSETLGLHEQCDGFLAKPEWNFDNTPAENYPLLLHYHPLVIYRHQVLKQADVVLAQVLLSDRFAAADKARNLAYYEPRTTHDSTLSACIYSIANAESGDKSRAYDMFCETYRMDLENRHGNTHYGLHMACMAGSWMALTYGFGGMRFNKGVLSFNPYLPQGWDAYSFKVHVHAQQLKVRVTAEGVIYSLTEGSSIQILHDDSPLTLIKGTPVTVA